MLLGTYGFAPKMLPAHLRLHERHLHVEYVTAALATIELRRRSFAKVEALIVATTFE